MNKLESLRQELALLNDKVDKNHSATYELGQDIERARIERGECLAQGKDVTALETRLEKLQKDFGRSLDLVEALKKQRDDLGEKVKAAEDAARTSDKKALKAEQQRLLRSSLPPLQQFTDAIRPWLAHVEQNGDLGTISLNPAIPLTRLYSMTAGDLGFCQALKTLLGDQ